MTNALDWHDVDAVADMLVATYPSIDPLAISFPKLHQMILALPDFVGDSARASEGVLEQIQMAWYHLVEE